MKNLIFLMMAILLINVSYAGELGEDLKGDCVDSPNHSRSQEVIVEDTAPRVESDGTEAAVSK